MEKQTEVEHADVMEAVEMVDKANIRHLAARNAHNQTTVIFQSAEAVFVAAQ